MPRTALTIPPFEDEQANNAIREFMRENENSAPRYDPFLALDNLNAFQQAVIGAHNALPEPLG